jgi:hypothetical protein
VQPPLRRSPNKPPALPVVIYLETKMKKIILFLMLSISAQSYALEIADVLLDEKVQLDKYQLVLNGAGVRKKFLIKAYIGSLYLGEKTHSADAVLADTGAKRMSYIMLRDVTGKQVLDRINEAIVANNNEEEMKALEVRFNLFEKIFLSVHEIKKGDIIYMDYIPGTGTRVSVNNAVKGIIEGADFYRSLLKTWVGKKPIQASLKKNVLGEE